MSSGEQRPRTWWNELDEDDTDFWPQVGVVLAVLVAAPLACLIAVLAAVGTIVARIRWWWPLVLAGVGLVSLLVVTGIEDAWRSYLGVYLEVGQVLLRQRHGVRWGGWLAAQLPLAFPVGTLAAAALTAWTEVRRPSWRQRPQRRGLWTLARTRLVAYLIRSGRRDAIAVDRHGRAVTLSHDETSGNVLVVGIPDSGKTVSGLQLTRRAIRDGVPTFVVDLKGSPKVVAPLAAWARRYGRPFWLFSFDGPCTYDPLTRGDPSRRKDLVIGAGDWPDTGPAVYFKKVAGDYLQVVFQVMDATRRPGRAALDELVELLDPQVLATRAAASRNGDLADVAAKWAGRLTDGERSALGGLRARIGELARSTAGAWLRSRPDANAIDLGEVVRTGGVVCFSLDALNYEEVAGALGGLIVQDCKTLAGELIAAENDRPIHTWVDEFSALHSDNIIGLLNKCREASMRVVLTTQSMADLLQPGSGQYDLAFLRRVIDLTNVKVIHLTNDPDSAQLLSALGGTYRGYDERVEVEQRTGLPGALGTGSATGRSMLDPTDKPRVEPGVIMELRNGQCILVVKSPKLRVLGPVQVIPVCGTLLEGGRPGHGPVPVSAVDADQGRGERVVHVTGQQPQTTSWALATLADTGTDTGADAAPAEPDDDPSDLDVPGGGQDPAAVQSPATPTRPYDPEEWGEEPS
jgi:TraM recognition site of TraD and TraG